jgi:hypothetical protein
MRKTEDKRPTWVHLIYEALVKSDDFVQLSALRQLTGASINQATAALHHLAAHKAAASMVSDGRLWWYATPDTDTRIRTTDERVPEEPGTRRGRQRRGKVVHP